MIEDAVVSLLRGSKKITDQVDTRIGPDVGASDSTEPRITYRRILTNHLEGSIGSTGTSRATILVTAWTKSYKQTKQLAEFVRLALQGFEGTASDNANITITLTDDSDVIQPPVSSENRPLYGVEMDFGVWHTETVPTN